MQLYVMKFVWLAAGWLFFRGTPVSSTNKTEDITEILLKVALSSINPHSINVLSSPVFAHYVLQ